MHLLIKIRFLSNVNYIINVDVTMCYISMIEKMFINLK